MRISASYVGQDDLNVLFQASSDAIDYKGPGALLTPKYQQEILDLTRKRGVLGNRINYIPATGQPSRYVELQPVTGGQYADPRNMTEVTPTVPQYTEHALWIRAITGRINYSLFDIQANKQFGNWKNLQARHLMEMMEAVLKTEDKALWIGKNNVSGSSTYENPNVIDGIITQLTAADAVDNVDQETLIHRAIKTTVAEIMAQENYDVVPTAVYMNPLVLDMLENEQEDAGNFRRILSETETEVVPGVKVRSIQTAAGSLPVITDPLLEAKDGANNTKDYPVVILTEPLVEYHWVGSPNLQLFLLGREEGLASNYQACKFGAPIVKGAAVAHKLLWVNRNGTQTPVSE